MRRRGAAVLLAACLLLPGCGLPLSGGVHTPGAVPAEETLPEPINVLPPGPQPDATPEEIVFGFLAAQSSSSDDHAVARGFLSPDRATTWDDDAGVTVFEPSTVTADSTRNGEEAQVRLDLQVVGRVGADGAATTQPPTPSFQGYRLRLVGGQWRLVEVPAGLTLSPPARARVLDPVTVHYLAPAPPGRLRHLVADLVQLQAGDDTPRLLVERLLAGPSSALAGSAATAVPPGTRLLSARASASGEVVVDLSGEVQALGDDARRDLSAQLVWTLRNLPGFSRLRLLVEGRPLAVPGASDPQPRTAWASYDPDGGTGEGQPSYAVVAGRLVGLDPGTQVDPLQPGDGSVLDAAVAPRYGRVALLSDAGPVTALRTGPPAGPLAVAAQGRLRSPTWGSGESGVWVLRTGEDDAVLRVPDPGGAVEVPVDGLPALDDSAVLRVSRDGVRVALVAGGTLWVGRVEPDARGVPARISGLRPLLSGVLDVSWQTGTSLVALVRDADAPRLPLLRLDVDGLVSSSSGLLGVASGDPVAVAAYGDAPLLVQTREAGGSTTYAGDPERGFEERRAGAQRPFYPG